jgi:hypothetical protein
MSLIIIKPTKKEDAMVHRASKVRLEIIPALPLPPLHKYPVGEERGSRIFLGFDGYLNEKKFF